MITSGKHLFVYSCRRFDLRKRVEWLIPPLNKTILAGDKREPENTIPFINILSFIDYKERIRNSPVPLKQSIGVWARVVNKYISSFHEQLVFKGEKERVIYFYLLFSPFLKSHFNVKV